MQMYIYMLLCVGLVASTGLMMGLEESDLDAMGYDERPSLAGIFEHIGEIVDMKLEKFEDKMEKFRERMDEMRGIFLFSYSNIWNPNPN